MCLGRGRGQDRATIPEVMKFLLSSIPPQISPREFCLRGQGYLSRGCWRHGDKQGGFSGEIQETGKGLRLPGWVFHPSFQPFPIFPSRYRYPQPTLPFLLQLVCRIIRYFPGPRQVAEQENRSKGKKRENFGINYKEKNKN